jgi:hypothetical protein
MSWCGRARSAWNRRNIAAGFQCGYAAETVIYASSKHWDIVIPAEAWSGGIASAILIGAFAGLLPAVRASDGMNGKWISIERSPRVACPR